MSSVETPTLQSELERVRHLVACTSTMANTIRQQNPRLKRSVIDQLTTIERWNNEARSRMQDLCLAAKP